MLWNPLTTQCVEVSRLLGGSCVCAANDLAYRSRDVDVHVTHPSLWSAVCKCVYQNLT